MAVVCKKGVTEPTFLFHSHHLFVIAPCISSFAVRPRRACFDIVYRNETHTHAITVSATMSDVESNDSEPRPTSNMPPRAKSAYHPTRRRAGLPPSGDSGSSLESGAGGAPKRRSLRPNHSFSSAPGAGNLGVRRRASFAALPNTNKPALRRGMSVVPSNMHNGQNTGRRSSLIGGQRTAEERAFADEIRAQKLAKKQSAQSSENGSVGEDGEFVPRGEVCGMCGNCGEGDKAMPPWAPERLAKLSSEQRNIVLMDMRAKEEGGKLARELRLRQLELAQMSMGNGNGNNGQGNVSVASSIDTMPISGVTPPKRRPPLKRQSTRLSAVLAPGNNSDARRARAAARAARISEMETVSNVTPNSTLAGQSNNDTNNINGSLSDDEDDDSGALNLGVKIVSMDSAEKSELEELGAVSSTASSRSRSSDDCSECDALENRLKDLEEQLGVLRNVVKASSPTHPRASSLDGGKKTAWHERVLGTFAGAPPGSETYKLKEEVGMLRKATNTLFSKLQDADTKRAGNNNHQQPAPTANHI